MVCLLRELGALGQSSAGGLFRLVEKQSGSLAVWLDAEEKGLPGVGSGVGKGRELKWARFGPGEGKRKREKSASCAAGAAGPAWWEGWRCGAATGCAPR